MINIIIKKNNINGWVELPLLAGALNSIRPDQFLNTNEMVSFTIKDLGMTDKRMLRFLEECPEEELTKDKANPLLQDLIRWINDSYGLLLSQNKNTTADEVCHGIWKKLHYTKHRTSPVPVTSKSFNLG